MTVGNLTFYNPGGYFDISTGWNQMISFRQIWISGIAICFSIAFFNFFGLSVTDGKDEDDVNKKHSEKCNTSPIG